MRGLLLCVLVAAACGDNGGSRLRDDAGTGSPGDASSGDASSGAPDRVTGCMDTPGAAAAPTDRLPCDLVPPGLRL
jgi:hypothetical protein